MPAPDLSVKETERRALAAAYARQRRALRGDLASALSALNAGPASPAHITAVLSRSAARQAALIHREHQRLRPALERLQPGATAWLAQEHRELLAELDLLQADLRALRSAAPGEGLRLAVELDQRYALFAGDSLLHLAREHRLLVRLLGVTDTTS